MKKTTFLFNLLATTAMAAGAKADVISGDGWSFNTETGLLEVGPDASGGSAVYGGGNPPWEQVQLSNITSIKFDEGITYVADFYSDDYPNVHSVTLPESLESVSSAVPNGAIAFCPNDDCKSILAIGGYEGEFGTYTSISNNVHKEPKRIYTVEEARAAVEAAGTDTVNVRIRYK